HSNNDILQQASKSLAQSLENINFVTDVEESFTRGKEEYTIELLPLAHAMGISASDIASALRNSFFGSESIRQQRGQHEVRVRIQLQGAQREGLSDLYNFEIFTPQGEKIPLSKLAQIKRGQSHTTIFRRNGARVYSVDANVVPERNIPQVTSRLESEVFPELRKNYPNIGISYQGRQADTAESMSSLMQGFVLVLIVIYILLAIPLASYIQPIIVMIAIPFGTIGAFIGHIIMGYSLSVISIMGVIALAGVVINNSLVLIDYANKKISKGISPIEAIIQAGTRRFRPIILTTATTFVGLAPMILETSVQARFLIPMAISLGFGILFATLISLLLIPAFFIMLEDTKSLLNSLLQRIIKKEYH
ncbi:MAG TPA: efflux RND transporter permease subunit, partial [Epsilonproteobacteria bacterium]|nr:efflux RND transporter permease subunit [Campylobacterota bacterium]